MMVAKFVAIRLKKLNRTIFLKTLIFILIVLFTDQICGLGLEKLFFSTKDSNLTKLKYTIDSTKQDILILGSSRALHHYVPRIIQKKTGLSVYNCGFGGQGLQFSYIQLFESIKRHIPRYVIVDISPNILLDSESEQKLKILLPFYKRDSLIFQSFTKNKPIEGLKFISSIYPYNSLISIMVRGAVKSRKDTLNGYNPLTGNIDTIHIYSKVNYQFKKTKIPDEKFIYLDKIITLCNKNRIKSMIVVSPVYKTNEYFNDMVNQIKFYQELNLKTDLLNFSNNLPIINRDNYFYDNLHLNDNGATVFSKIISERIDYSLKKNEK